ncbi:MAG: arabinan endo-1,5-alpha-L-arabinosidase [Bacteroides sp.]|nr:arabinan endo-1,5-alpha-L-arabinosidase [Bacteroides sp.]
MNKPIIILTSLFTAMAFFACTDGLDNIEYNSKGDVAIALPSASATTGTSLTLTATLDGNVGNVVKRGFCYSLTNQTPTIKDNMVEADENFTATITGLKGNTEYFVRAFVYGNSRYTYSETFTATTGAQTLEEQLASYEAPTYDDNYTAIAGWENNSKWNLANVHDPSVMLAEDGYYYMYQTDASYGNAHEGHGHFHCRRSKDLVNWEYLGATMEEAPAWAVEKLNEYRNEMINAEGKKLDPIKAEDISYGYWAPVVRKVNNGLYRMYYSLVIDNYIKTGKKNTAENFDHSWTERAFIGLMETSNPASNQWEDKGMVVCSASDQPNTEANGWGRRGTGDWDAYFKFNAIDPTYTITPEGKHWLIYGSWHSGFAALEVNPSTGMPLTPLAKPWTVEGNSIDSFGKLVATRGNSTNRWQASEGPDVIYNPQTQKYYMFMAYGQLAVAYNTRVVRADRPEGPYVDMQGNSATAGIEMLPVVTAPYKFSNSNGWVGISHCGIFDDGQGNWYYTSQGRFPVDVPGINASNAIMMGHVRSILWTEDGWPIVMPERYGAVPKVAIAKEELEGNWELIQMKPTAKNSTSDGNATQYESKVITLGADGKVTSEAWGNDQTWSFDAAKNMITIGNNKIYIQREVDWEASPRIATIVGGGYQDNGATTNWMKKVK